MSIIVAFLDNNYLVVLAIALLVGVKNLSFYLNANTWKLKALAFGYHCISTVVLFFAVKVWKWVVFDLLGAENGWQALGFLILITLITSVVVIVGFILWGVVYLKGGACLDWLKAKFS